MPNDNEEVIPTIADTVAETVTTIGEVVEGTSPILKEGVDGFFTSLTQAGNTITTKLVELGPVAAEAILNLVQFKGIFSLTVGSLLFITISVVAGKLFAQGLKLEKSFKDEGNKDSEGMGTILSVASAVVGSLIIIFILKAHFTFYNIVAAFYPAGALALKALEAVGIVL